MVAHLAWPNNERWLEHLGFMCSQASYVRVCQSLVIKGRGVNTAFSCGITSHLDAFIFFIDGIKTLGEIYNQSHVFYIFD